MKGRIDYIDYKTAKGFLMPKHYSGRMPSVTLAFGWYIKDELVAVMTIGKPASNTLCDGICGKEWSKNVYELNRLCRVDHLEEQLSSFVAGCLRRASTKNMIIVSYSDTKMNHNGYIYQACNFIYTGVTKQRTEQYTTGNKHSRHSKTSEQKNLRKIRYSKHRYVYFAFMKNRDKKSALEALNYKIEPYPKGENKNYVLGEYLKPTVYINKSKNI